MNHRDLNHMRAVHLRLTYGEMLRVVNALEDLPVPDADLAAYIETRWIEGAELPDGAGR